MAKIFISHSSVNNAAALAIAQWLAENGWDDFFLDIEPARGLSPGERWQEALKAGSDRCEAVLCLISPAWRDSPWCIAELLHAKQLGKIIFGAFIEPTPLESLPREMTAEWQLCDLVEGSPRHTFQVGSEPIIPAATEISFAAPGLERLKLGLQRAGLDASTFPWPPDRAPYRGFKALEAEDAAVFFGRAAEMVRGLDTLRRLRERDIERILILLGASGAGKSSFLRAGLWPRLKRDDRRFLPLPVIRPERAAITCPSGLAASLEAAFRELRQPRSRADVRSALAEPGGLNRLLVELQSLAAHRLEPDASPPDVVLEVDQAEELLGAEGRAEAEVFLSLLAQVLEPASGRRVMAVLAIRSDSFERLQSEPLLERACWDLFDLRPLARTEYRAIVEGPAARATLAGRLLRIDPELTERLLSEAEGADALPLLAFTLERLFVEHGGDGALSLPDYEALGGLRGSIEEVVKAAFAEPGREPAIPADEAERMRRLRAGFIPWLARIDPDTEERKRRVARLEELPVEARPLIERLISARLLLSDRRRIEGHEGEAVVVEVAHEALLRQWPTLAVWLDEGAAELKALEATRRAAGEWSRNDRREDWLTHTGDRLRAAETLRRRPDFDRLLGAEGNAYLEACRQRDDKAQAEREAQSRRVARAQRRIGVLLALIAVILLCAGSWIIYQTRAVARQTSFVLASAAKVEYDAGHYDRALRFGVLAAREGWLSPAVPEAEAQIIRAAQDSLMIARITHSGGIASASFSPDGQKVVSASREGTVRVWDAGTGKILREMKHGEGVGCAAFSSDGRRIISTSPEGTVRTWDVATGKPLAGIEPQEWVSSASFSSAGRLLSASWGGRMHVWEVAAGKSPAEVKHDQEVTSTSFSSDCRLLRISGGGTVIDRDEAGDTEAMTINNREVTSASFSPDGRWLVSASQDGTMRAWDAVTGKVFTEMQNTGRVFSVSFSPDGRRVVSTSEDGTVNVFDVTTGRILAKAKHREEAIFAAFSLDGRRVVSTSQDGVVLVWDASTGNPLAGVRQDKEAFSASLSPDGRRVVSDSFDGTVSVWDVSPRKPLSEIRPSSQVSSVSLSPDGRHIVTASGDGTVRVSDTLSGQILAKVKHSNRVSLTAFSPDSRRLVSASDDGTVRVSDALSGRSLAEVKHSGRVRSVSFSPDGRLLVSTSDDGMVRVSEAQTGKALVKIKQMASMASFSPNGQQVVSVSDKGDLRVWDASTGEPVTEMMIDKGLTAVSFSPDGKRIFGFFGPNQMGVWDARTGEFLTGMTQAIQVDFASFTLDGRRLVGADELGRVFVLDGITGQILADLVLGDRSESTHLPGNATSVLISSDNHLIAAVLTDGTVQVWDTHWLALHGSKLLAAVCRKS
jgi:WD40 repeat protein